MGGTSLSLCHSLAPPEDLFSVEYGEDVCRLRPPGPVCEALWGVLNRKCRKTRDTKCQLNVYFIRKHHNVSG